MPFCIIPFIVLVVVLIVYGAKAAAKRKKELIAFAAANGLSFSEAHDHGVEDRFNEFDCFGQGSDRYGYNTMQGQWNGRQILAMDYHYETESTDSKGRKSTTNHYFSAVILFSRIPLKPLFLRPEGFFDKVTQFFGYDDIDFESAEFSRKFYVKAADRKWAFDVIHPRAMALLLGSPRFSIEFDTGCVIAYRSSTFKVAGFIAATNVIEGLLDGLPEYVRRDLTGKD